MQKEIVVTSLTKNIRASIQGEEVATRYTQKGVMTENQMHWDLLTQEEYALRRHAGSDMNTNAEGYVNYTLAMNATGVLAV